MSTVSKQARQRIPASERRDALVAAAMEEFAIGGLHGTPVDRIARRVGVAQPYVFSLFATKRELFIAAVERGFELVSELFTASAADFQQTHAGVPYTQQELMKWLGEAYIHLLASNRSQLMLQLQAYAACDDEVIREHVSTAYAKLGVLVQDLTGFSADELNEFLSHGMWLNVQAALGIVDLDAACDWIRRLHETDTPAA